MTELQQILDNHAQEGMYLDFKRGDALVLSSQSRKELVKDCTGFANADGGMILYGVAEEQIEGVPAAASLSPVVTKEVNGDWITNVICSNTSPPLSQFDITELAVNGGRVIAIEIKASSTAHQSLIDHRYYQRMGRNTGPMADFQIRDVMSRRLRPEVRVEHRLVNIESNGELHRKALEVVITNIGQVTLENWQFEIDLPYEVARDSDYPDPVSHIETLVESWCDRFSFARGSDNQKLLRISHGDPDEEQNRRLLHPGQTRTLVDPNKHPTMVVEIDHAIWEKIHGRSIFWRIFLPNAQPIKGEWRFDEWCDF